MLNMYLVGIKGVENDALLLQSERKDSISHIINVLPN